MKLDSGLPVGLPLFSFQTSRGVPSFIALDVIRLLSPRQHSRENVYDDVCTWHVIEIMEPSMAD